MARMYAAETALAIAPVIAVRFPKRIRSSGVISRLLHEVRTSRQSRAKVLQSEGHRLERMSLAAHRCAHAIERRNFLGRCNFFDSDRVFAAPAQECSYDAIVTLLACLPDHVTSARQ